MSVQWVILVVTAVLAVVAVVAAVVTLRALRQIKAVEREAREDRAALVVTESAPAPEPVTITEEAPSAEVVRIVEGRVIVQPTQDQLVAATMTRPAVRLNVWAAGIAHALRPESRDRILGLMRREYRGRKRARQRAARAAARATNGPPPPAGGRDWVGS
ncbi:hypothetical protein [Aeromicrobium duanguangcaii]|uniref:Uncharacterized protein n=1 Tax=Aeromicrobium duanguangcaii TaxID=2968086 RepID=A0ABY5KJ80_9ACTN|nr:hypothetical protein [Aeromicrobium duanguangcaii]MCD9153062.1 hypothetical protein [Aeromicrobium duanguangcaii]MCL3836942.1 hypothetical protein [Aeromicrobium duanguangcaii]UUI69834.1 hypothetical protein NP095_07000 [Aeromicrobium duanguangcaii]